MKNAWLTAAAAAALALAACSETEESAQLSEVNVMQEDPFLWLEEVEGERALDWVRGENDRSLAVLKSHPAYAEMYDEALAIFTSDDRVPSVSLRDGFAYNFWRDKTHVRGIYRRMPIDQYLDGADEWETLIDVDRIAEEEDENWVFSGLSCLEPDNRLCLLRLSRGGADATVTREYDLEAKAFVEGGFELPEAKSSVSWIGPDTLLVGTDYGDGSLTESGYPRISKRWQRGTPLSEAETVFEGEVTDVSAGAFGVWDGEKYLTMARRATTFYDTLFYVLGDDDELTQVPVPMQTDYRGFISGDHIFAPKEPWTFGGATFPLGSLVALSEDLSEASLIFAPSAKTVMQGVSAGENDLIITLLDDIEGKMLRYQKGASGWTSEEVPLPEGGIVGLRSFDEETGNLIATFEDPITTDTFYWIEGNEAREIRRQPEFFDSEGMVVQRFEATSSDGTKIPYTVTALQSTLDAGPAPTVQYGYGGFEVSNLPTYNATAGKLWVERGGIYVNTNIRGGGEYGPSWHQAGLKGNRQIIYDDFFAISEDLIARGITTAEQLGIHGGSNGGLLMGVSMVQRPDLYQAVAIGVPLLDMLRYDKLLAGASWVGEYGDPDNPEERPFLEEISPYQNLEQDADYPRPFIYTSTRDDRVHPGHARKFGRLLKEYSHPFLYYENIEGGHGAAANLEQSARNTALRYAYFAGELGLIDYSEE